MSSLSCLCLHLHLATGSERKRNLLKHHFPSLAPNLALSSPDIDEKAVRDDDPGTLVQKVAAAKVDATLKTIETAGVALMDDDLRKLPQFVRLSRTTHAILVQNITLALGIKAVFLALTLAGEGTLWMAVFADMGASLLVVFNGLRLLRKRF